MKEEKTQQEGEEKVKDGDTQITTSVFDLKLYRLAFLC